jgi:hypothetical protein
MCVYVGTLIECMCCIRVRFKYVIVLHRHTYMNTYIYMFTET